MVAGYIKDKYMMFTERESDYIPRILRKTVVYEIAYGHMKFEGTERMESSYLNTAARPEDFWKMDYKDSLNDVASYIELFAIQPLKSESVWKFLKR